MVSLEEQPLVNSFNKVFLGAAGGGEDLPSEDEFNRVAFLSHFEGANNGVNNAFDDSSDSNRTVNVAGEPTQGSFGPFARPEGEFGVDFRVDGTDLSVPTSTDLNLGTGDFTLECFIFVQNPEDNGGIMSKRDNEGGFGNSYRTSYRTGSKKVSFAMSTGSVEILSPVVEKGIWTHIAVVRDNGTLSIYAAGVQGGTATSNTADEGASWPFTIGSQYTESGSTPQFSFIGQISNVRFVKGTAVYSGSSFTPPTGKLTAITNTKLLTCQSNRFVDNSASGRTITPAGNTAVTAFGPFLTSAVYDPAVNGASAYFDGNGDYLSVGASNDFDLSDGDITYEFFAFPTAAASVGGNQLTVFEYFNAGELFRLIISTNNVSLFQRVSGGDYALTVSGTAPLNAWTHIAVTRASNNEYKIFCNGILGGTSTNSIAAMPTASVPLVLGRGQLSPGNRYFPGYITDFRLTKGSLVYTSNFTPPTAPLTAITNTKLLLNMADGQAIDSAAQNNLTLYGNANTSTDQVKFGDAALHLDGTGDFAKTELSTAFGTGDFTIECFYYNSASFASANRYLFDFGSNGLRIQFYNGAIYYIVGSSTITTTAAGVTHNNWYHLAAVRYNGQMNLYIDGVSRGTQNSVTDNLTERSLTIGDYGGGSQALLGFIDEFRISNFARYTSNFTAPTAAFADKGQDA